MLLYGAVSLTFWLYVLLATVLTASLPAHIFPPSPINSLSLLNSTLPASSTLLDLSSNALPTDPVIFRIADSSLLLSIHDYGPRLLPQETYRTFQNAVNDVIRNIWPDPTRAQIPMVPRPGGYLYGTERVRLMVRPQPAMTWRMWAEVLGGLRLFVEEWEFVAFEYGIWDGEGGRATFRGNGNLRLVA